MTAATALATVPDSYKPLAGHILPAMFEDASGRASINTDGVLRQHTSNVQRYMYISTDYFIQIKPAITSSEHKTEEILSTLPDVLYYF